MVGLLFSCLALPLLTALAMMLFRSSLTVATARWIALIGAVATFLVSLQLAGSYSSLPRTFAANAPIQPLFQYHHPWLELSGGTDGVGALKLDFFFGLDGISIAMIVLATLLTVSAVLISWEGLKERATDVYIALLVLEAGLIGVFCAFDVVLFYAFFELTLIPLFFIIAIAGGAQRKQALFKFFLYTLAGSLITLLGVVGLVLHVSSTGLSTPASIPDIALWLQTHPLSPSMQTTLFLMIAAGFLVKLPVVPFHTWLPVTYVEAPVGATVLVAGVMSKLGALGFLRLCLPMFPEACLKVGLPVLGALSVIGIIYGSLCALGQRDLKRLVAYSSIAHLAFCTLGLFSLNVEGITGGVLQMVNHGLSTGALFLLVGMIYERYQTRNLDELHGLAARLPLIACGMVFITMASIGLPGLNGFAGEVLCLAGMFKAHPLYGALGTLGVILGAWYLLTAVQAMFFGPLKETTRKHENIPDMNLREMCSFVPLAAACLWIGLAPGSLVDLMRPDVVSIANIYHVAGTQTAQNEISEIPATASTSLNPMTTQRSLLSANGN